MASSQGETPTGPSRSPRKGESLKRGRRNAFLQVLFRILSDENYKDYIRWDESGEEIIVKCGPELVNRVLQHHYSMTDLDSFHRQLNMYNFEKTNDRRSDRRTKYETYRNPGFRRDMDPNDISITRRKGSRGEGTSRSSAKELRATIKEMLGLISQDILKASTCFSDIDAKLSILFKFLLAFAEWNVEFCENTEALRALIGTLQGLVEDSAAAEPSEQSPETQGEREPVSFRSIPAEGFAEYDPTSTRVTPGWHTGPFKAWAATVTPQLPNFPLYNVTPQHPASSFILPRCIASVDPYVAFRQQMPAFLYTYHPGQTHPQQEYLPAEQTYPFWSGVGMSAQHFQPMMTTASSGQSQRMGKRHGESSRQGAKRTASSGRIVPSNDSPGQEPFWPPSYPQPISQTLLHQQHHDSLQIAHISNWLRPIASTSHHAAEATAPESHQQPAQRPSRRNRKGKQPMIKRAFSGL